MMFPLTTELHNQTDHLIEFDVARRVCTLPSLGAGKAGSVDLSQILRCCRAHGSNWLIRVLLNGVFTGIHLHPIDHLLYMARIIFKCEPTSNGYVFSVGGVKEKRCFADYLRRLQVVGPAFGKKSSWNKREVTGIVQIYLREEVSGGSSSSTKAAASGPKEERRRAGATSDSGESLAAAEKIRSYQLLALRRKHMSTTRLLLLTLAFSVVVSARFLLPYRFLSLSAL